MPTKTNDPATHSLYGAKVAFLKDSPIQFDDFILTFVSERLVKPPQYARGILYFDFLVVCSTGTLAISWSAGTGDICPTLFTIAGNRFSLELGISIQLGTLNDNELVLTKALGAA